MREKVIQERSGLEVHPSAIGFRVAGTRQTRGWSQRQLARRASLRPERLCRLESGASEASVQEIVRLSEALELDLYELVYGRSALEMRRLQGAARGGFSEAQAQEAAWWVLRVLTLGFKALEAKADGEAEA